MSGEAPRLRITEPGIYDGMSELDYHADPVAAVSISRSEMKILIEASPAHLYARHPRLGGTAPTGPASGDDDMDIGTAVHSAFLQGIDKVAHVPFDSFRTNAAKEFRDEARAEGKIPLKTKLYDSVMRVTDSLETNRRTTGMFTHGKPEQTLIWDEGQLWCRARIDWLPDDSAAPLLDLKTTGSLATTAGWGRTAFQFGADLQASLYPRGCEFLRGEPPDGMLFVVVETDPPYAVRVFGLDPIAVEVGAAKAAAARALWVQCRRAGHWPSYPLDTEWILPPPWIVRQWEETKIGGFGRAVEDTAFIERLIAAGQFGG